MSSVRKGLAWGAAMLMIAAGSALGWVEAEAAQTMLIVIPALALTSMQSGCGTGTAGGCA